MAEALQAAGIEATTVAELRLAGAPIPRCSARGRQRLCVLTENVGDFTRIAAEHAPPEATTRAPHRPLQPLLPAPRRSPAAGRAIQAVATNRSRTGSSTSSGRSANSRTRPSCPRWAGLRRVHRRRLPRRRKQDVRLGDHVAVLQQPRERCLQGRGHARNRRRSSSERAAARRCCWSSKTRRATGSEPGARIVYLSGSDGRPVRGSACGDWGRERGCMRRPRDPPAGRTTRQLRLGLSRRRREVRRVRLAGDEEGQPWMRSPRRSMSM